MLFVDHCCNDEVREVFLNDDEVRDDDNNNSDDVFPDDSGASRKKLLPVVKVVVGCSCRRLVQLC